MYDTLAGVEMLVREGIAERSALSVVGGSHGGFMATWMVTQCDLFSAAVALAPVTDFFSCHFTSSDPDFDRIFLASDPYDTRGRHFSRSPIMFARDAKTPTLLVAGALDRCTPQTQALEFHRALVQNGAPSELVVYPREGHGVREFDAYVDYCTRILYWLQQYAGGSAQADRQRPLNRITDRDRAGKT